MQLVRALAFVLVIGAVLAAPAPPEQIRLAVTGDFLFIYDL